MRPAWFALVCLGALVACESNRPVRPTTVQWMDWPAEVNAAQPFRTHLIVWGVCAAHPQFHPGVSADQSAVTFSPFFVTDQEVIYCLEEQTLVAPLLVAGFDTAGTAPGLAAPFARTYEMRGSTYAIAAGPRLAGIPARTFGDVIVRPTNADQSRRNAAGLISLLTDIEGCVRMSPLGARDYGGALPLEDQADTVGISYTFIRGYIYDAATPVCGQTRVFHLTARE